MNNLMLKVLKLLTCQNVGNSNNALLTSSIFILLSKLLALQNTNTMLQFAKKCQN